VVGRAWDVDVEDHRSAPDGSLQRPSTGETLIGTLCKHLRLLQVLCRPVFYADRGRRGPAFAAVLRF
jgi:hypothetical protein